MKPIRVYKCSECWAVHGSEAEAEACCVKDIPRPGQVFKCRGEHNSLERIVVTRVRGIYVEYAYIPLGEGSARAYVLGCDASEFNAGYQLVGELP